MHRSRSPRLGSQLSLLNGGSASLRAKDRFFGGAHLGKSATSHAKRHRPLDSKAPMHLVLRSSHARGELSFLRKSKAIQAKLHRLANQCGVEVHDFANVGNHMHLIVRVPSRRLYVRFIRAFSGVVARMMTGANKYTKVGLRFWDQRPFSRVLSSWGKPLRALQHYLQKNKLEALGFDALSARALLAMGIDQGLLKAGLASEHAISSIQ